MEEEPKPKRVLVFKNVQAFADHLGVSKIRLRKLKGKGRLNYTTDAVLVPADEVERYQAIQAMYRGPTPYVPRSARTQFYKGNVGRINRTIQGKK